MRGLVVSISDIVLFREYHGQMSTGALAFSHRAESMSAFICSMALLLFSQAVRIVAPAFPILGPFCYLMIFYLLLFPVTSSVALC